MNKQKALFCAGPFWHSQLKFSKMKGVIKTLAGYEGGNLPFPTYAEVSTGNTGHVEVVEITYDADIISYVALLEEFWKMHDPTSLVQYGVSGSQYKSTIFYYNDEQRQIAEKSKLEAQKRNDKEFITEIKKATKFYLAEENQQYYFLKQKK
jgi:peptide-methionine (S)-S-oxide reductase